jgi:hypothetical protein
VLWLFIGFIVGALLEWLSQIIFDTDSELEPEEEHPDFVEKHPLLTLLGIAWLWKGITKKDKN